MSQGVFSNSSPVDVGVLQFTHRAKNFASSDSKSSLSLSLATGLVRHIFLSVVRDLGPAWNFRVFGHNCFLFIPTHSSPNINLNSFVKIVSCFIARNGHPCASSPTDGAHLPAAVERTAAQQRARKGSRAGAGLVGGEALPSTRTCTLAPAEGTWLVYKAKY